MNTEHDFFPNPLDLSRLASPAAMLLHDQRKGACSRDAIRGLAKRKLTFVDLSKGARAEFLDNLEAALQNFLSVLQHTDT